MSQKNMLLEVVKSSGNNSENSSVAVISFFNTRAVKKSMIESACKYYSTSDNLLKQIF